MTPEERVNEMSKLQMLRAYQNVFLGSVDGQLVLWDLINECHVFRPFKSQNAGSYLLEGKRELGLHILTMVKFSEQHGGPGPAGMEKIMQSLERTAKVKTTNEKEERENGG